MIDLGFEEQVLSLDTSFPGLHYATQLHFNCRSYLSIDFFCSVLFGKWKIEMGDVAAIS